MDINNVLTYLKEELKDIPANPDNVHYTDFEGLYYILQTGLKGQLGGYHIKSPKTKDTDMELATVRNSHKLSDKERTSLSQGAAGGVKIKLFTDRILAAHRGTRKDKIAELPSQRKYFIDNDRKDFKKKYGYDMPDLTEGPEHKYEPGEGYSTIKDWLKEHGHENDLGAIRDIHHHNYDIENYYKELRNREREERFILKKSIPVDPKFMEIVIEKNPEDIGPYDDEFIEEMASNYLKLIAKHENVFAHNKNFRDFKNYLRSKANG